MSSRFCTGVRDFRRVPHPLRSRQGKNPSTVEALLAGGSSPPGGSSFELLHNRPGAGPSWGLGWAGPAQVPPYSTVQYSTGTRTGTRAGLIYPLGIIIVSQQRRYGTRTSIIPHHRGQSSSTSPADESREKRRRWNQCDLLRFEEHTSVRKYCCAIQWIGIFWCESRGRAELARLLDGNSAESQPRDDHASSALCGGAPHRATLPAKSPARLVWPGRHELAHVLLLDVFPWWNRRTRAPNLAKASAWQL